MGLTAPQTVETLVTDYLATFLPGGGAAVKVLTGDGETRAALERDIREAASEMGYAFVSVRASRETRLHLIHAFFAEIARQLPWEEAARRFARIVVEYAGYEFDSTCRTAAELAELNGVNVVQLTRPIGQALHKLIFQSPRLSRNVKHAIFALVNGALDIDGSGRANFSIAEAWFKGESVELKKLKELYISSRVARNNARNLLYEVATWFSEAGYSGIAVYCDASQFLTNGATRMQALDFYEIVRQLIDNVGLASNLLVLIGTGYAFVTDERRGLRSYDALAIRLADDFYDTNHPNPLAPFIQLDSPA